MSRPAASCALMIAATASRYCSRNSDSPSADLNERPSRLRSNHSGRGYDPVIAVGNIMFCVTLSIPGSSLLFAVQFLLLQLVPEIAVAGALHDSLGAGELHLRIITFRHGKVRTANQKESEFRYT